MDAHEDNRRLQFLSVSDSGRRRRWTDDWKARIAVESCGDGVTLAEVARRRDMSRSQLYDWRFGHKNGLLLAGLKFLRSASGWGRNCPRVGSTRAGARIACLHLIVHYMFHITDRPVYWSVEEGFEICTVFIFAEPFGLCGKCVGADPAFGKGDLVGAAGLQSLAGFQRAHEIARV